MEKRIVDKFNAAENIIIKVEELLNKNDDESKKIRAFMEKYISFDEYDISLELVKFYLRFKENKKIMKLLIEGIDKNHLWQIVQSYYNLPIQIDLNSQFYSYFNLVCEKDDPGKQKFDIIANNFDLKKNILEVGCGFFPSVAQYVDKYQTKVGAGTITCYDKELQVKNSGNIRLKKENIEPTANIKEYDYMYAFNACTATSTFLELAQKNQKEFILGLCGCSQNPPKDFYEVIKMIHDKKIKAIYESLPLDKKEELECIIKFHNISMIKDFLPSINCKIYAIYLAIKLTLLENEKIEYKLLDTKENTPIITKKYLKTLF